MSNFLPQAGPSDCVAPHRPSSASDFVRVCTALRNLDQTLQAADSVQVSLAGDALRESLGGTDCPTANDAVLGNDRFLPEVKTALLNVLEDLPAVIHKALGEGKNNAPALVLKLRNRLPDLIDRISLIANAPLLRIREYATRETRLREVGDRYRVWYSEIQNDNAAIIGNLDAMLELEATARRETRTPSPPEWLPHLRAAGCIIKARNYLDLVDPATRTEVEIERFGYELLKAAANEPCTLPEMLN